VRNKKTELFDSLHQDYFAMVLQMCLGFVSGDQDKANDLAQEVFIKVWTHLDSFKGLSSYKTWIYRITVNTCLQLIRKEKKRTSVSLNDYSHSIEEESQQDKDESVAELYHAIGQLKETERLIIMMVLEGQSNEDIAEVLGLEHTTVRVKIHRIKKKLNTILNHG
jgi:RNA polymerase sigma-70 factor (ECF subfamily)